MTALYQLDAVLSILNNSILNADITYITDKAKKEYPGLRSFDIPAILEQLSEDKLINIDLSTPDRRYYSIRFQGKYVIENGGYFESARKESVSSDLEERMLLSDLGANKFNQYAHITTGILALIAIVVSIISISNKVESAAIKGSVNVEIKQLPASILDSLPKNLIRLDSTLRGWIIVYPKQTFDTSGGR